MSTVLEDYQHFLSYTGLVHTEELQMAFEHGCSVKQSHTQSVHRFCDCHHPNCNTCNVCDAYEQEIATLRAQLAAAHRRIEEAEKCEPVGYGFTVELEGGGGNYLEFSAYETNMPLYTRPVPPVDVAELQNKYDESVNAQNELHEQICEHQQRIAELENRLADETAQLDLMNVEYRKSELHCAKLAQAREKAVYEHCMCAACRDGTIHSSDCSVHNMPAYPNGSCDCGVLSQAREKAVTDVRAFGLKVAYEISSWIDANDPLPDVEIIVDAMLAAQPHASLNAKEGGE